MKHQTLSFRHADSPKCAPTNVLLTILFKESRVKEKLESVAYVSMNETLFKVLVFLVSSTVSHSLH